MCCKQAFVLLVLLVLQCCVGQAATITHSTATATPPAKGSRYVVGCDDEHKQQLRRQLLEHGYSVVSDGPGFLTVVNSNADTAVPSSSTHDDTTKNTARSSSSSSSSSSSTLHRRQLIQTLHTAHQHHMGRLSSMPGVHSSEQDVRRFLHIRPSLVQHVHSSNSRTLTAAAEQSTVAASSGTSALAKLLGHWHMNQQPHSRAYEQWGAEVVDAMCAARDELLAPHLPGSEVVPWGIKEIGAWDPQLQQLPHKGRTIVCIIDSGLWAGHPEYNSTSAKHNYTFTGCGKGGSCPYVWSSDVVGHGTHVAGTISAPQNGLGVVGVMSQGAELHVVRVWNDSGDVSQGQGPYATDLVLAYNHCLGHLKAEQAKEAQRGSKKKVNMVINMSYGSAGPLTVERMWLQKASQRGDILFVGSAGNNGSWLDVGKRAAGPASLSGKEPVGQYLSYPASYKLPEMLSVANARCDGSIEFTSQKNKQVSIAAPGMAILSSVPREYGFVRGHISTTAQVTTGARSRSVGYLPNGFLEPRPIQGSGLSRSTLLPLVSCSIKEDNRLRGLFGRKNATCPAANGAICYSELPGRAGLYEETCTAMLKCVRSGGEGLVVWRQEKQVEGDAFYMIPPVQLDCGEKCKCWPELKALLNCSSIGDCSSKAPPGIIISTKHAAALTMSGAGKGEVKAVVATYEYNYKYFDGTSMAAPHVSGAAALLWRQFPDCKAADIATAMKTSAQRLPGQTEVPDYAAGYGMLKVDKALTWARDNLPCAQQQAV